MNTEGWTQSQWAAYFDEMVELELLPCRKPPGMCVRNISAGKDALIPRSIYDMLGDWQARLLDETLDEVKRKRGKVPRATWIMLYSVSEAIVDGHVIIDGKRWEIEL